MKAPENIHGRLRLTYMGLAIVPLLVVGIVLTWTTYAAQRAQVLDLQQELAQRVGTEVEAVIQSLEDNLTVTAQVTGLDSLSQAQQEEVLEQLLAEQKAFTELTLLDEGGLELARNNYKDIILREEYRDRSDEDEFQAFEHDPETTVYYSPVRFTPDTNEPVMTIAIPLIDKSTRTLTNVFMADVRLKNISDLIASIEVEGGDNVYIVQGGKVIAHRNPSIVLADTSFNPPDEKGSGTGLDGVSALMGIDRRQFGVQTFTVVAETPATSVLELAINSWMIILGLVAVTIGAAALLAIVATNRITRPIQSLVSVAENIREGNLFQQAKASGLNELDTLASTFNSMTAQLRQTLAGLEQRVAERTQALKTSAEVSRYLSTILDAENLVTEVATLVQSTFNYYHVNIYLFDETAQNLVLAAGTGEAGQAMLDEQHQLSTHQGLVGQAATTNKPVLVANVNLSPDWKSNRWLPDTNAELVVPIARGVQVLGVLDIQHNVVNGLKQEDADLMQSIANQLAVALLNAQSFEQLVAEKLAEAQQKEEAEKHLEAYRRSPVGQAEIFARQLLDQPENALAALYELAQSAGQDSEAAALLSHLPRLLEGTQPNSLARDLKNAAKLAKLAEGVNFLFTSQNAPELLLVGLRTLTHQLEQPSKDMDGLPHAHIVYQACLSAVEANAISQITQLDWRRVMDKDVPAGFPLTVLVQTLAEFQTAIDALTAYERVNTLQDKLAYLVSAVERLRHIERRARNQLGSADVSIILRIVENWQAIIARALSELQTQARLNCRLLTRHTWHIELISITLNLRNEGRGAAINIRISLLPGPEYTLIDETAELKQLNPGEEAQVVLRVRPRMERQITQFRASFVIVYEDPRGPNQSEHFADVIQLLTEQKQFQHIPNPYIVGTPLEAGSALFFGREDLMEAIQENLAAAHRNNLVLIGQRRMGKTSLLKQLSLCLDPSFIPVYLDGQAIGLDPGMAHFFLNLATEIVFALEDKEIEFAQPDLDDFESSPASTFEHQFLPKVLGTIGQRPLLILFDEFEELESAVLRGYLDVSIFNYLRHLMQHTPNLSFIFCGTHRLEELVADYWNVLFNISLYQRVGYISQKDAMRLVQQPVEAYGMRYDDLALDKIWRVTAGHPYFLQLICHSLVNRHNKTQRNYVTVADVNAALDEILGAGEAHFIYLWTESTPDERLALVAMSRMIPLTGSVQPAQVVDYLEERGVQVERRAIREALHHLMLRDILKVDETEQVEESIYRWQLGLLGLWVEKYKSLGRVLDEVAT